jgi:hypothetical protein
VLGSIWKNVGILTQNGTAWSEALFTESLKLLLRPLGPNMASRLLFLCGPGGLDDIRSFRHAWQQPCCFKYLMLYVNKYFQPG